MKKALLCFIATLILMVTQLATSVNAPVPAHYESKISTVFLRADNYYSTTGSSGIAALYQRDAVVAYADKYWDAYNPAYDDYSGSGWDCANFVSQCMVAGGLSLWKGRDGSGGGVDSKGAMPFCDYLRLNLVDYQSAAWTYIEYSGTPPADLSTGDVIIYGDVEVGKTVVTKYTLDLLLQEAKNKNLEDKVNVCYINCKTVGSECQPLGEIINFLSHQRVPSKGKGWGKSTYYNTFKSTLNERGGVSIIVLDEVDKLAEDAENVLYNLSRANSTLLTNAQISLIGISNKIEFYEGLDSRTKSSMCQREIFINPYNAQQLQEIFRQRAELAFHEGVVQGPIINLCSAMAAQGHGDARKAIDLLRAAGEVAELEKASQISEEHLREVQRTLELNRTEELIKGFTAQKKIVLLSLLKNELAGAESTTGTIYDIYRKICRSCGLNIPTQRRVTDMLSELGTAGIAQVRIFSRGRYGSTKEITLIPPFETIEKALMEDEMLKPLKDLSFKTYTQKRFQRKWKEFFEDEFLAELKKTTGESGS